MEGLIERQAAIDLLEDLETKRLQGNVDLLYAPMMKGLKQLTSAQPEIIHCRDCKLRDTEYCNMAHGFMGMKDDDYCSYAERREVSE